MSMIQRQSQFMMMVAGLIREMVMRGYLVSGGCLWCLQDHHKPNSKHKSRLAIDINLFDKDGRWLKDTKDHAEFGELWEDWGGRWGGRWNDGNHYEWMDKTKG